MNNALTDLFSYSHTFNQEYISLLESASRSVIDKSLNWMCHTINAHGIWNARIQSEKQPFGVWQTHRIIDLKALDSKNYDKSLEILDSSELDKLIYYTDSEGLAYNNSIRDIFLHINNHATYHRGQIAQDLRSLGILPLPSDYIFFKRELE